MALIGKLVFLCAVSLTTAQSLYDNQKLNATQDNYDKEEISRILQTPLFRRDAAPLIDYSRYLPVNYAVTEPKQLGEETRETVQSYLPIPSLILQPPKVDAANSFVSQQAAPEENKNYPTFQSLPIIQTNPESYQNHFAKKLPQQIVLTPQNYNPDVKKYIPINPLSKQLDLPLPNSPAQTFTVPSAPSVELQTPLFQPYVPYNVNPQSVQNQYSPKQNENIYKVLSQTLETPYAPLPQAFEAPKSESIKPTKLPTKLFPKKYISGSEGYLPKKAGKSLDELDGDDLVEITKIKKIQKPLKLVLKPQENLGNDGGNLESYLKEKELEKQRLKFEDMQKKNILKKEAESQQELIDATRARASSTNNEPVASETGFTNFHEGRSYSAPTNHAGLSDVSHGAGEERTDFQMHGHHGPNSYKFGYDTGKGKNRQFRYEERDKDGYVKGHYGFYDKHGKLQVVNYDAHPHHGFHAEGPFEHP